MPGPRARPIQLSEKERAILEQIVRQPSSSHGLVSRSQIILGAASGETISGQARGMGLPAQRVRHWRRVWSDSATERDAVVDDRLRRSMLERILADAPRAGAPSTFSPEQVVQIIAVSCEEPSKSGYPDSHWSQHQLAREAVKRGIVEHISGRQVGRFLKRGGH